MKTHRILITAIGGDIGSCFVRHIKESLPQAWLIGCDITPFNQGIGWIDQFYVVPGYDNQEAYWSFIENLCIKEGITHFCPIAEAEIKIADEHREFFYTSGIKLLINNHRLLTIAMDKYETAFSLDVCGIGTPKTWKSEDEFEKNYPLVVKGRHGCGSRNVRVVYDDVGYK